MRRLGGVALLCALSAAWAVAQARDPVLEVFRTQLELEKKVLSLDVAAMERNQDDLRDATDRMVRLGDDLLRAEKEDEDSGAFNARSLDLRRAESEVADLIASGQQLRASIASRRAHLELVAAEVKRLQEAAAVSGDEISGKWDVSIEPGGLKGTFDLRLDGTLVNGTYQLSGDWKGSLRGTYIDGNVRLERIDSQLGFVATYTGRVAPRDGEKRLEGTWEGTNLAAGMATSGNWVARKQTARP